MIVPERIVIPGADDTLRSMMDARMRTNGGFMPVGQQGKEVVDLVSSEEEENECATSVSLYSEGKQLYCHDFCSQHNVILFYFFL